MREILPDISLAILFLLVIYSLVRRKKLVAAQKLISILIFVLFLNDFVTRIIEHFDLDNHWVYHVFVPIQFLTISFVYAKQSAKANHVKWIKALAIIVVTFSLINTFIIEPDAWAWMPSMAIVLSYTLQVVISLIYLNALLTESNLSDLGEKPLFWLSIGIILYSPSLVIFIATFKYYMFDPPNQFLVLSDINALFYVFFTICCAVALWVKPKTASN